MIACVLEPIDKHGHHLAAAIDDLKLYDSTGRNGIMYRVLVAGQ